MGFPWVCWNLLTSFVNSRKHGWAVVANWLGLRDKEVSQKLFSSSALWSSPFPGVESCASSLLHLHPSLRSARRPCSLGERLTSSCWRLVNLSLSLWWSGRRAVSRGSCEQQLRERGSSAALQEQRTQRSGGYCPAKGCRGLVGLATSYMGWSPWCSLVGELESPYHKSNQRNLYKKITELFFSFFLWSGN